VKPLEFIHWIAPAARAEMKRTGIKASLTIAQAILESAWGRITPRGSNNIFGIKYTSAWKGGYVEARTVEFVHGRRRVYVLKFRKYKSIQECIQDHSRILLLPRYYKVRLAKTGPDTARGVAAGGYATDPKYADKLIRLMRIYKL